MLHGQQGGIGWSFQHTAGDGAITVTTTVVASSSKYPLMNMHSDVHQRILEPEVAHTGADAYRIQPKGYGPPCTTSTAWGS